MILFAGIFLIVLVSDYMSKEWVRHQMPLGSEISLLPFFSLTHIQNTGIAFGLFPGRNWFSIVSGCLLSGVILWMAYRTRQDRMITGVWALILAGAWGNLWDRMAYGRVTDFLDIFIGQHHWPAFNVADSAICIGAVLLVWQNPKKEKKDHPSNNPES